MMDDEIIAECVNGQYANGFAMLVATNHRVLLVDKKPLLYLTVEDLRFEMITEFNYNHRLMDATIRLFTANKTMVFTSWNQHRLRKLLEYVQAHVLEMRQQNHMAQQFQAAAAAQFAQMHMAQQYSMHGQPAQQAVPTANYAPNLAQQSSPQPLPETDEADKISQAASKSQQDHEFKTVRGQHDMVARFARRRVALGTYTRSKLPSFRVYQSPKQPKAETGEVYQQGMPKPILPGIRLPYEYEA
jgi:hypothetical protein